MNATERPYVLKGSCGLDSMSYICNPSYLSVFSSVVKRCRYIKHSRYEQRTSRIAVVIRFIYFILTGIGFLPPALEVTLLAVTQQDF